jgi:Mg-chelatase subunit ChlD
MGEPRPSGPHDERLRRWRLVLGGDADGTGHLLGGTDAGMDAALAALYGDGTGTGATGGHAGTGGPTGPAANGPAGDEPRGAGLGASAPRVARWLRDIRAHFPAGVVHVMQKDAIDRLDLTRLLLEPEMLDAVEPDVHLVGTLLALNGVMPERAKESVRAVVRSVVADLERRLSRRTMAALSGALHRAAGTARPRHVADIDWHRTIRANLRHRLPGRNAVVPARLVGRARRRQGMRREVVLCVDQSGSMASSFVYAGVFGAVLAALPALRTSLVAFDTAVVDLTDRLHDPVDLLLGAQLGGGTDIGRALAYVEGRIHRPADAILVLISDLFDGGARDETPRRVARLTEAGVQVIVLLALSDDGTPGYDQAAAAALAALGVPAFACTPDVFPELMAAAIERRDIGRWAERHLGSPGEGVGRGGERTVPGRSS